MAKMTNDVRKKCARELFFAHKSQKFIAEILDVSEQTVSGWVTKEGWGEERAEATSLRKSISSRILMRIDYNLSVLENNQDKDGKIPDDKGIIDALSKLFANIKQREMSVQQQLVCLTNFLEYAQAYEFESAKKLVAIVQHYLEKQHNND